MKKALSLFLAIMLVISIVPMTVLAAGTGPEISFSTTFTEDMAVDATFSVTATLDTNPGFNSFGLPLTWNSEVVEFLGFEMEYDEDLEEDVLATVALSAYEIVVNNAGAILTGARTKNTTKTGKLFTANFKVVGSGKAEIGFLTDNPANHDLEFNMGNAAGEDLTSAAIDNFDYSAIANIKVAGGEDEVEIPAGAPFSDVNTDKGKAGIRVKKWADLMLDPYGSGFGEPIAHYHITVPEGTEEAYIKFDVPASGLMSQTFIYGGDPEVGSAYSSVNHEDLGEYSASGMSGLPIGENGANYTNVIIPMTFIGMDMGFNQIEMPALKSEDELYYAVGPQYSDGTTIALFSFEYGTAGGDEDPTYSITIDDIVGGTVTVMDENLAEEITEAKAGEYICINYTANSGYRIKNILMNGEPVDLMNNGLVQMPAEDVVITAEFELIPPTTYDVTIADAEHGTVTADKTKAAAGEKVTLTVTPAEGYVLDTLTVMHGETPVEVTNNAFTMPAGAVTVTATFKTTAKGYTFAISADQSANSGDEVDVHIKVTGHSDGIESYNAYDLTLTFDDEKLEYVGFDGAVKSDNGEVKVEGNTIRIVGCGADKAFDAEIATLTFKIKEDAEGSANVTISKVQISDKEEAVKVDAPKAEAEHADGDSNADETPDVSVITVPYSVTKPEFVEGNDKVLHGEDYTFSYTDTDNYTYSELVVSVGGTVVTPAEEDGVYTLENVTGAVVIEAIQTPNSYPVTKPENVTGPDMATFGTDYIFTVTPGENMAIESVKVMAGEKEIPFTINDNGEYVIKGKDISGAFEIIVTEKESKTTITFSGVEESEVEGGLTQLAEIGKDFTFKLNKVEGFEYTVKVDDTELEENEGSYTIPKALVVAGGVVVTIEKTDIRKADVEVYEYIKLDEKTMFLVIAKWDEKVLAYGEEGTMYYSSKYALDGEEAGAYCWLVISDKSSEEVKAAAVDTIIEAAAGENPTAIAYGYDVNITTKVDVNDAQLVYDMYKAAYDEFTENLTMRKFLEADLTGSKNLDTQDVAAVVNYVVSNPEN